MSGFDPAWLALREPADARARDRGLAARLAAAFAGQETLHVADLGCGTGANLRATAALLPPRQHWTLIDHDPALLAAARAALEHWAPAPVPMSIATEFVEADLAAGLEACIPPATGLVTTSALLDLVSPAWLERLASVLAARRLPLHAVLTVDGVLAWDAPHRDDAAVVGAFAAHMRRDKGFGPAAGATATDSLAAALRRYGYTVVAAASPWRLGDGDVALAAALARGIADAAAEMGVETAAWRAFRLRENGCTVGHQDILALPP
ncbi:MAG: methyltransferase domain-containing protein [Rhodospirillales bacterium]